MKPGISKQNFKFVRLVVSVQILTSALMGSTTATETLSASTPQAHSTVNAQRDILAMAWFVYVSISCAVARIISA